MLRTESDNYVEETEPKVLAQRYSVRMTFNDENEGMVINGTLEFEIDVVVPKADVDGCDAYFMEADAERKAFYKIETSTAYGRGELPNLHIDDLEKTGEVFTVTE